MNTSSTASHTRARRRILALTTAAAAAGVVLAVAAPLAASAHIHVDPGSAAAGTTSTLTFAFSHGCDESPTTALVIDIPDGVGNATPIVQGGWTITRELGADGVPTQVTYTSTAPVEPGLKATVGMDVLFDEATANTSVAFPVTQVCAEGSTAWTEIAADGEDAESLESPAPAVEVGAVAEADEHGHGSAAEAGGHDATGTAESADPVARWLAGGALALGIAALVVALVRGRERRS